MEIEGVEVFVSPHIRKQYKKRCLDQNISLEDKFYQMLEEYWKWWDIKIRDSYNFRKIITNWKENIVFAIYHWFYELITYTTYSKHQYNLFLKEKRKELKRKKYRWNI